TDNTIWHHVQESPLHGLGVFATKNIPAGTCILEYCGERISPQEADELASHDESDPGHTFFFALSSGEVIDGGQEGNDARWINHCCEPNCEAQENDEGTNVYIVALRDINAGEELFFDYGLVIDDVITQELKNQYKCLCARPNCRGSMLAALDIEKVSGFNQEQFTEQIAEVIPNTPWIAERVWLFRPFSTVNDMHSCIMDVITEA